MALDDSFESLIFKDEHTIFITSLEDTTEKQLDEAIKLFFSKCSKVLSSSSEKYKEYENESIWSKWHINIVITREGHLGVAYVYFQNPAAYYIMIGRNIDGSHKLREAEPGDHNDDDIIDAWDIPDVDRLKENVSEGKVLVVDHERIVDFPSIKMDDGSIIIPNIRPCVVILKPETYETIIPNHLFSQLIMNQWVTAEMIKERFQTFCSCKESRNKLYVDIENGKIFVKFHPGYNDAHFALKMNQKVVFTSPEGKECSLYFEYRKKIPPVSENRSNRGRSSSRGNRGGYSRGSSNDNTNWRKR